MDGHYWSVEACAWVRVPRVDALSTPWSATGVPLMAPRGRVRDAWDVLGWFPPLPGLPQARPAPARESERTRT